MVIGTLALLSGLFMVAFEVSRAWPQRGMKSCQTQRESVDLSVHPSIHLSTDSPCLSQSLEGWGNWGMPEWTEGLTDGRAYRFPVFYRTCAPWG